MNLYVITGILIISSVINLALVEGVDVNITGATDKTPTELNCTSVVEPYTWTFNEKAQALNSSIYEVTDSKAVGVYTCSSGNSTISYNAANFSTPIIGHGEKSIKVTEGDTDVTVSCTSDSSPTPTIYWMIKKENKAPVNLSDTSGPDYTIKTNGTHSSLTISSIIMETRADYECNAFNLVGSGSTAILVRVQNKLAPLWAFLAVLGEIVIMIVITLIFARRTKQKKKENSPPTESENQNNEAQSSGVQRRGAKED